MKVADFKSLEMALKSHYFLSWVLPTVQALEAQGMSVLAASLRVAVVLKERISLN